MGTLLLVGEAWRGDADGSVAPRGPSLKGALKRVGYDVVHTEDGAGALAQLRLQPPDLIVLAGAVPDMELLDLCAALRHDPAVEKTPFIVVGDAAERTGRTVSRTGADVVFPPSVGPVEIADRLRRLF
jgi:DNA-binding response OmpR family regulator